MSRLVEVRPGVYHDSVTLMQLSQTLQDDEAVTHAQVSMGTTLNLDLLVDQGYERPEATAGDLVIALDLAQAEMEAEAERLLALVDRLLTSSGPTPATAGAPGPAPAVPVHTLRSAVAAGATVALISVPGEHAFRQGMEAIEAGAHPIVFSDNVPVEQEVELKRRANRVGLLAMGPDCGTVVLAGVGLGFANVVTPGPIGLVSASGTGAQQVCAITDHAGVGVRHVLGVGGRDLTDEVGGLSTQPALRLLDADPDVAVIGIVAKTIGARTGAALDALRAELATATVLVPSDDLTAGATELLATLGVDPPPLPTWAPAAPGPGATPAPPAGPGPGRILGLYSGGTLAAEAERITTSLGAEAEIIDLGDDEYTRGRPHPMIDARLRLERLEAATGDDEVAAVLLDVVLGHGAAADPATELAPALAALTVPVHVALIGTVDDPQGRDGQVEVLAAAGATVHLSNAAAARAAAGAAGGEG